MERVEALRKIPLLSPLTDSQLSKIASVSVEKLYPAGSVIFTPGESAEGFYVLKKGKVKIFKTQRGKEQIIKIFSEPAFFGEAASFTGGKFPAWAEAIEDSEVIFIPRSAFISIMKEDPDIALKLMSVMANRLLYLTNLIESLSLKNALSKVAAYILRNQNNGKLTFKTNLAALELGLTKETVSRMLSKLKSMGAIEKDGNVIKIKNLQLLREVE